MYLGRRSFRIYSQFIDKLSTIAIDEFASIVCRSMVTAATVTHNVASFAILRIRSVTATSSAEIEGRVWAGLLCMPWLATSAADQ